ncbi:MAG: glycoside hydrolase family 31 [Propionibacteriaceae bacterium]|jgi:alpha-glucosidase (family GH31 glycosyl hydrolase)|nr:glycoside hydrolase family 31 [Propionibacteriaceae bacterium]
MIQHRPVGAGHPYVPDTEQRWPVHPVAGEQLRLGVRCSGQPSSVTVEIQHGEEPVRIQALFPVVRSSRGQSVDGGHLAAAQARQNRTSGGWQVELSSPPAGEFSYRFVAVHKGRKTEVTRWFTTRTAQWRLAAASFIRCEDSVGAWSSTTVSPGEPTDGAVSGVEVLDDGQRIWRVRFALPLKPGEHVVGFGERYDRLDQVGATLDNQVFEQYKSQGMHRRTYFPIPFAHVIGGDGWGFHVRTSRRVWFDIGASRRDRIMVEAESDLPSGDETGLHVGFYQGMPSEVLDAFLAETGRPQELPAWVFKLWASGNEWNSQSEVMRQIDLHQRHRIPVGNVVIEAWSDESTFTIFRDARYQTHEDGSPFHLTDFSFPPDGAWPDPKGMVDTLHEQGVRVHLWQIPLMKMRPHPQGQAKADAEAALRDGVLVSEEAPDGSLRPYRNRGWWFPLALMPDLTDERAARWWTDRRRYLVDEIGVDGFKTDGGEHAWGPDLVYLDGRGGAEKNNTYPVGYAAAYGRLLSECGKAPVTFSRSGYTGSSAHGAFWAGDENSTWEAFRWSIMAGLNAAASGVVYWGWDIAGFSGPTPDAELYIRAMAASAFVPIMQYHSEFNHHRRPSRDRTPWNIAAQTGDAAVIGEVRQIVELRERLIPYLAAQARAAVTTSKPLMRPMFFDFVDDPVIWEHPLQWMLGDDLLVTPVLEPGANDWPVYLPRGSWVDAWCGEAVQGPVVVASQTPRHRVPVYVRADRWAELRSVFEHTV